VLRKHATQEMDISCHRSFSPNVSNYLLPCLHTLLFFSIMVPAASHHFLGIKKNIYIYIYIDFHPFPGQLLSGSVPLEGVPVKVFCKERTKSKQLKW